MSGVVFAGLEAVFTEIKVVTVPAFESGAVYREHLTAITPADNTHMLRYMFNWAETLNILVVHSTQKFTHRGYASFHLL